MNKDLFLTSLNDVKAKLDAMRKNTSLVFMVFSDLHTTGVEAVMSQQLLEALGAVSESVQPDAVIDLGAHRGAEQRPQGTAVLPLQPRITPGSWHSAFLALYQQKREDTHMGILSLLAEKEGLVDFAQRSRSNNLLVV